MCPHWGKGINCEAVGMLCGGLHGKLVQMLVSECQLPPSVNCSVDITLDLASLPALV